MGGGSKADTPLKIETLMSQSAISRVTESRTLRNETQWGGKGGKKSSQARRLIIIPRCICNAWKPPAHITDGLGDPSAGHAFPQHRSA